MREEKLEKFNNQKHDLDYVEGLVSDLKHINSKHNMKKGEHHYCCRKQDDSRKKCPWFCKIKKLFISTSLTIDKKEIRLDPQNIRSTILDIGEFKLEENKLKFAKIRSKTIDFIINELERLSEENDKRFIIK